MARLKIAPAPTTPEAELAGLLTTRDNLRTRQISLTAEVEQAVAARRELLIGGANAAAIADAERSCREIESTAFGITDALAEIERRIGAAQQRIEEARAAAERESAASMLERDSKAVDAAAARVRRAVEELANANASLAQAITPVASPLFALRDMHGLRDNDPPERIAAYLVGHMIATAIPSLDVAEAGRQEKYGWVIAKPIEPTNGNEPANTLLTEPMRTLAGLVRSGEASPMLTRYERPEPDFEPDRPEMQVYVVEAFSYVRKTGYVPEAVFVRQQHLPVPVAQLAIKRGLASEVEPEDWETLKRRAAAGGRGINIFEIPPIGFNLEEWREAEKQRRRNAWLAEQHEAA